MEMKIFYVTNPHVKDQYKIPSIIEEYGDTVEIFTNKDSLRKKFDNNENSDLILCDRCTFLLTSEQISSMNNNCFNIHPSLLPYNRGYHPNFWSFYDGTPTGTTIHAIDENIDSGNILAQTEFIFSDSETLRTSYYTLRDLSISLFRATYPSMRRGYTELRFKQNSTSKGSIKYKKDFDGFFDKLPKGWDTTIGYVRRMRLK